MAGVARLVVVSAEVVVVAVALAGGCVRACADSAGGAFDDDGGAGAAQAVIRATMPPEASIPNAVRRLIISLVWDASRCMRFYPFRLERGSRFWIGSSRTAHFPLESENIVSPSGLHVNPTPPRAVE